MGEFCYNSIKQLTIKMNPFELALGAKVKQPMDLAIFITRGMCHEGGKEVEEMAIKCEERKA